MSKSDRKVKCVVWDLDNTIWDGILLEDGAVRLRAGIVDVIRGLDERGILQSIASRNDYDAAMAQLKAFGLDEYFLYPQISWNAKSAAVRQIAQLINIGIDTLAFIDDQPFEREEVAFSEPAVLCLDVTEITGLLDRPEMNPKFITEDSRLRRQMYMADIARNQVEAEHTGSQEEFLATLGMVFHIGPVTGSDLQRAEELTVRTHQLNATGYTYSYEELVQLWQSDRHQLLIASLEDRFGTYGKIGLALVECSPDVWTLKLLLMSCRVMSRGVGGIMLNHIMRMARAANVRLRAEFVPTDRNRMMYITYKFAGFTEVGEENGVVTLEGDLSHVQPIPDYVTLYSTTPV